MAAPTGCVARFEGETTNYTYTSSGGEDTPPALCSLTSASGPFYSPSTKYYVSPSVHHVTIGKLRPSTTYHYQVLLPSCHL
eukprot:767702-Hanusia_phi.AAC.4